jgi:UDP-3-O-[3-hydroxymyristoyl] glucosamine N-acyltransferase
MVDSRFFKSSGAHSLSAIIAVIGAPGVPQERRDAGKEFSDVAPLETAGPNQLSLAAQKAYSGKLKVTGAGAVFVSEELAELVPSNCVALIYPDPHRAFVLALELLFPSSGHYLAVRPILPALGEPMFESGVNIGPNATIGSGAQIGEGTQIGPNVVIGPNVTIGRNTRIDANVSIECALIGDNVTVRSGARIGTEGFGWLDQGKANIKIPQLGRVIIQAGVDIGANATIDRGALGDTVIGDATKIDNLVQIGHNCQIGRGCLIAATTGLSGGTIVGDGVLMGGGVGTSGHLEIGAGSVVHGRAAVTKDWPDGSMIAGAPAQDIRDFWRELAVVRRLAKGGKR